MENQEVILEIAPVQEKVTLPPTEATAVVGPLKENEQLLGEHEIFDGENEPYDGYEEGEGSAEIIIPLSHESLDFQAEVFRFKKLHDPGIDDAILFRGDPPKIYEPDGQELFLDTINFDNLTPIRRFHRGLKNEKIDLRFSRLDPRILLPISNALSKNTTVTELNLGGNILSHDAAFHIAEILTVNKVLRSLNLNGCRLGSENICKIGEALEVNHVIKYLDLSKNDIEDKGMEGLSSSIGYNSSLKHLVLRDNQLTYLSGTYIADVLTQNDSITHLDISWNDLGSTKDVGVKKLLIAIGKVNETLEYLNMSWNRLSGDNQAIFFKNMLTRHKFIQELDISNNGFQGSMSMESFCKGINSSESLKVFNLSFNTLSVKDVSQFVLGISPSSHLKHLKLINFWILRTDYDIARENLKGKVFIEIEGTRGLPKEFLTAKAIQTTVLKRCHYLGLKPKKKKNKREFCHFLLRLQEDDKIKPIKKSTFEDLLANEKVRLEPGLANELIKWFRNEKKRIDLELMLKMYMELYPDTKLPPKKKKKGEKIPPSEEVIQDEIKSLVIEPVLDTILDKVFFKKEPESLEKFVTNPRISAMENTKAEPNVTEVKKGIQPTEDTNQVNSQQSGDEVEKINYEDVPSNNNNSPL